MKVRKKSVVLDAEQWYPGKPIEGVTELNGGAGTGRRRAGYGLVETPEGPLRINPGDYVVTGLKGEKFPVRQDVFLSTYEVVGP